MTNKKPLRSEVEELRDRLNGLTALVVAHIRYPAGQHYTRLIELVEQSLKLQKEDTP